MNRLCSSYKVLSTLMETQARLASLIRQAKVSSKSNLFKFIWIIIVAGMASAIFGRVASAVQLRFT